MSTASPQPLPKWLKISAIAAFAFLASVILVVTFAPDEGKNDPMTNVTLSEPVRFTPAIIVLAKRALLAEPQIKDVRFDPAPLAVTWDIGVLGDGTARFGYAEYICHVLRDLKAVDRYTTVRIVDVEKVIANGGDFRAASLGQVDCSTGMHITL